MRIPVSRQERRVSVAIELVGFAAPLLLSLCIFLWQDGGLRGSGVPILAALLFFVLLWATGWGWVYSNRVLIGTSMLFGRMLAIFVWTGVLFDASLRSDSPDLPPVDLTRVHYFDFVLAAWAAASVLLLVVTTRVTQQAGTYREQR